MQWPEILQTITENRMILAEWRADEDFLLREYQTQHNHLRNARKERETELCVRVLEQVNALCESGLNDRASQLEDLVNGFSITNETLTKPRTESLVPIKPFFDVAGELKETKAGMFVRDVMLAFQKKSHDIPKDKIRLIGVESKKGERISGIVLLCDNNRGTYNTHIGIGYDVFYGETGPNDIKIRSINFLSENSLESNLPGSFDERFRHMLLAEQVAVIGALFAATDRAVTEALGEVQAPTVSPQAAP